MGKQCVVGRAARASIIGMIGIAIAIVDVEPSLAQYRHQKSAICSSMMNAKGLKGDQRKSEYQRCMIDPGNYK
jgi:hypothetical protein